MIKLFFIFVSRPDRQLECLLSNIYTTDNASEADFTGFSDIENAGQLDVSQPERDSQPETVNNLERDNHSERANECF